MKKVLLTLSIGLLFTSCEKSLTYDECKRATVVNLNNELYIRNDCSGNIKEYNLDSIYSVGKQITLNKPF